MPGSPFLRDARQMYGVPDMEALERFADEALRRQAIARTDDRRGLVAYVNHGRWLDCGLSPRPVRRVWPALRRDVPERERPTSSGG